MPDADRALKAKYGGRFFACLSSHGADPNNVQTGLCPRLPLPVISSNEGDPCSGSRLKRHERSHMDSVRRSHRYDSLNDLFSSAQHRPTQLDQLPSRSFTLNPAQRDSEVFLGQLAVAFSSA